MSEQNIPKHQNPTHEERTAVAPYNFVPLPSRVVPAEPLPNLTRYDDDRYTGTISCELTTASPLYVRCALTTAQFQQAEREKQDTDQQTKNTPEFFYTADKKQPVIPGSSLRGMLRSLVEITGYGKMDRVTDQQHFFFRAVAAKSDDPLSSPYKRLLKNVQAGYLVRNGESWFIQPVTTVESESFIKVRERDIPISLSLITMRSSNYRPQYINVSFTTKTTPNGRTVVDKIDEPGIYASNGVLVTSGNMQETGKGGISPRKNHCVVLAPNSTVPLKINDSAVQDYRLGLTGFQQQPPFDRNNGVLEHGRPVFYCTTHFNEEIVFFGHSPNFRIPYRFPGSKRAASPSDFIPPTHRSPDAGGSCEQTDLAEAIFGFVRQQKAITGQNQARAGRVFVSDATLVGTNENIWYSQQPIVPPILGSPKPTTFQHYLTQDQPNDRRNLRHYASTPGSQAVIRGTKLYWHRGPRPKITLTQDEQNQRSQSQLTKMLPVNEGVSFGFTIRFEQLSAVELGALLWVLRLGADPAYRLKLGMGKPLGMGAVAISEMKIMASKGRAQRYRQLLDDDGWKTGEDVLDSEEIISDFEAYVLQKSGEKASSLADTPRIKELRALLSWPGPDTGTLSGDDVRQTRYMEIERTAADTKQYLKGSTVRQGQANEYAHRPVLPTPMSVAGEPIRFTTQEKNLAPPLAPSIPSEFIRQVKASKSGSISSVVNQWRALDPVFKVEGARVLIAHANSIMRPKDLQNKSWYQELLAAVEEQ